MARKGVNKVILVGNLGADPEISAMSSGKYVANFRIATSEYWNDKNTGQKVERTEWHKIVCYDRLAEIVRDYVKKGMQVYIEGRLETQKYNDQNGIERFVTKVIANELQMLGGRAQSPDTPYISDISENYATSSYEEQNTSPPPPPVKKPSIPQPTTGNDIEDDIPF